MSKPAELSTFWGKCGLAKVDEGFEGEMSMNVRLHNMLRSVGLAGPPESRVHGLD